MSFIAKATWSWTANAYYCGTNSLFRLSIPLCSRPINITNYYISPSCKEIIIEGEFTDALSGKKLFSPAEVEPNDNYSHESRGYGLRTEERNDDPYNLK